MENTQLNPIRIECFCGPHRIQLSPTDRKRIEAESHPDATRWRHVTCRPGDLQPKSSGWHDTKICIPVVWNPSQAAWEPKRLFTKRCINRESRAHFPRRETRRAA